MVVTDAGLWRSYHACTCIIERNLRRTERADRGDDTPPDWWVATPMKLWLCALSRSRVPRLAGHRPSLNNALLLSIPAPCPA